MKIIIFTFSFLILTGFCNAQWVQTSGMNVYSVNSISGGYNYLFAGTENSGIYRSTNNGLNWTQTPLNGATIHGMVTADYETYAGAYHGVYMSVDNGNSWYLSPIEGQTIFSLEVIGFNVFAGTGFSGIYFSSNVGVGWVRKGLDDMFVGSLIKDGGNIIAGTEGNGVYYSTNNGNNWIQTALNNKSVFSLAIIGNRIFAGTSGYGVYVTTNYGNNWSQTSLNNLSVWALAVSGNNLFAGTLNHGGVFLSTNFGLTWIQKNQGFTTVPSVPSLFVFNNYIFAGTQGYNVWRRLISDIIGINKISSGVPDEYKLWQNYPNPFNPATKIRFDISNRFPIGAFPINTGQVGNDKIELKVFDIIGREVITLVNEKLQPGTYEVTFNGSNLPSGIYFYRLKSGDFMETKKLILIK